MTAQQNRIRNLALAFIRSITRMTPKQKDGQPSDRYGENFNVVLAAAKRAATKVAPELWPKPLETFEAAMEQGTLTDASFGEIETYARQVAALLEAAGRAG